MTGFDRAHVELAFGPGALPAERMLAAQRRELEELRCRAADPDRDGEDRAIARMDGLDLAGAVDRLTAHLEAQAREDAA